MALDNLIKTLELLVPIAKTVPVLGSPVEGSLEAAVKILRFAQGVKTNKEEAEKLAQQAAQWTEDLAHAIDDVKADTAELERLRPDVTPIRDVLGTIAKAMELHTKQSLPRRLMDSSKNKEELTELRSELKGAYIRFMFSSQIRAQSALSILLTDADAEKLSKLNPISSARHDSLASPSGCLPGTRQEILANMLAWAEKPREGMSVFWLAGLAGTGKSTIAKTFCEQLADKGILMATFFASRNSAERRDPFNIIHTFAYELAVTDPRVRLHALSTVRSPPDIMQRPMKEQIGRLLEVPLSQALSDRPLVFVIDALDECDKVDSVEGGALIPLLAEALRSLPVKLLVTSRQERSLEAMFKSLAHIPLRLHEIASEMVEPDVRQIFEMGFMEIRRKHELTVESWLSQEDLESIVRLTGRFLIFAATALRYIGDSHFSPAEQLCQVLAHGPVLDGESAYAQIDALYTDILHAATQDDSGKVNVRLCQRIGDLLRTIVLLEEPLSVASLAHLMGASEPDIAKAIGALSAFLFVTDAQDPSMAAVRIFHPSLRDFLCDPERCPDRRFLVDISVQHHVLAGRCLLVLNQPGALARDICHLENPSRANLEIPDLALRLGEHVSGAVQYACVSWPTHLTAGDSVSDSLCTALLEFCRMHLFHWIELLSLMKQLPAAVGQLPTVVSWCQTFIARADSDIAELLNDAYRMLLAYYPPIHSHALHVYESPVATMPRCALLTAAITAGARLLSAREGGWNTTLRVIEGPTFLPSSDRESPSSLDCVFSLAVSPDGKHLASGFLFGPVRVWSATTGDQVAVLSGLTGIEFTAFSPDGTRLATNSVDAVRLWDTTTYTQLAKLRNPHGVGSGASGASLPVVFSPMGKFLVNANIDGTVYVWDLAVNIQAWVIQNNDVKVTSVAWSPDGNTIVSGSTNGMLDHWDARTGVNVATLRGHGGTVTSLAYSPDGMRLVSGSDDRTIWVWDMGKDEPTSVLRGHSDMVTSVAFSPDGRWVISGSRDKTVRVWDVESTDQLVILQGHSRDVSSVAVLPDGTEIVSGSHDGTIRVWDVETLSGSGSAELLGERTSDVVISPDGSHLVSIVDKHGRIWDVKTGKQIATLDGHTDKISDVAFSLDSQGLRIVTGSWDLTVRVWDTQTGRQLAVFEGHGDKVSKVALSPDSARAVSGASDWTIRVWDVATGEQLASFEAEYQKSVTAIALSPDGLRVVACSYAGTTVWDVDTGAQIALLECPNFAMMSIAFSSDSKWLYTTHLKGIGTDWLLELTWDFDAVLTHQHGTSSDRVAPNVTRLTTETSLSHTDPQLQDTITLSWNYTTGWLSCVSATSSDLLIPLCWLPVERRENKAILRGWQAILGGMGGSVTILDFTDAINQLACLGIV